MKATFAPKVDIAVRLKDGRQMAYAEWGDLRGRPVVFLHGAPGARLFCPDADATEAAGVRLLTIDRPGYGLSDPRPARTLLNWTDDYVELARALDLPPCPVIGWSSGGPYALALAFRTPDRVTSVGLAASVGPVEHVPGAFEEHSPAGRAAIELLVRDRNAGISAFSELCAWFDGNAWQTMFDERSGAADDEPLADPVTLEAMKSMMREAGRQGSTGLVADYAAEFEPWGFSVADIRQPTYVWSGGSDPLVGQNHGEYLAATIPGATHITFDHEGHLIPISHWNEMLAALT